VNVFSGDIYNGCIAIADGICVNTAQIGQEKEEYIESSVLFEYNVYKI
jgi:hypothetical protein